MKEATHEDMKQMLDSYDAWKQCITVACNIPLTADYIEKRTAELKDAGNEHTKKFIKTLGKAHLQKVIGWFEQAAREVK